MGVSMFWEKLNAVYIISITPQRGREGGLILRGLPSSQKKLAEFSQPQRNSRAKGAGFTYPTRYTERRRAYLTPGHEKPIDQARDHSLTLNDEES